MRDRANKAAGSETILVAGKQTEDLQTLVSVLTAAGYEVTATADLDRVADIVTSDQVRGAILDLESSTSTAYEALDAIRSRAPAEMMPIICLSYETGDGHRRFLTELGADDLLSKPIDGEELVGRMEELLSRAALQTTMKGDIKVLPVIDLLQMVLLQRQSGVLQIRSAKRSGYLAVSAGKIVEASFASMQGEQAAVAMARLGGGSFSFHSTTGTGRVVNEWSKTPISFEQIVVEAAQQDLRDSESPAQTLTEGTPERETERAPRTPPPAPVKLETAGAAESAPRQRTWSPGRPAKIAVALVALMSTGAGLYIASGAKLPSSQRDSQQVAQQVSDAEDRALTHQGENDAEAKASEGHGPSPSAGQTEGASPSGDTGSRRGPSERQPAGTAVAAAVRDHRPDLTLVEARSVSEAPAAMPSARPEVTDDLASAAVKQASAPPAIEPSSPMPPATESITGEAGPVEAAPQQSSSVDSQPEDIEVGSSSPPRLIEHPALKFPHAMRRRISVDTIDLRVLVNEDGRVTEVNVLGRGDLPSFALDRARKVARKARFEPALEAERRVAAWTRLSLPLER